MGAAPTETAHRAYIPVIERLSGLAPYYTRSRHKLHHAISKSASTFRSGALIYPDFR
jgi:hypothetical protein